MKKIFKISIIILIVLILGFGYLDYSKYQNYEKDKKQREHDNLFKSVIAEMRCLDSITIEDKTSQDGKKTTYEVNLVNGFVKSTESVGGKDTVTYMVKNNKKYYTLPETATVYSIQASDSPTIFDYEYYLDILSKVKTYTKKNDAYIIKPSLGEVSSDFLNYKTIIVKLRDNSVLESITAKNAENEYNIISFKKYDATVFDIPTEILARIEE
jgi:hypothetical protein